jgi:hypothetical protein
MKSRKLTATGNEQSTFCLLRVILLIIFAASGCAYNVQPVSTRAVNLYSAYENKIPGNFVLVMDNSLRNVNREITPASYVCGAHRFPITVGDSVAISIKQSLDAVFEQVREQGSAPPADQLNSLGLNGVILIRLDDFSPRILCHKGFFSGTCTASTDLSLGVTVRGSGGILASMAASGSKTADGDAGVYCSGGADVLGDSITRATRDALERLGERLSNSPKLREAGVQYVSSPASQSARNEIGMPTQAQVASAPIVSSKSPTTSTIRHAGLFLTRGPIVSNPPQRFIAEFYDNGKAAAVLSGIGRLSGDYQIFAINESIAEKYATHLINPDSVKPQIGADARGFAALSSGTGTELECSFTFIKATGRGEGACADNQRNTYRLVFD